MSLNHSVHFTCICLHPPFIHPSLLLKAKYGLILCFSLFFTFKAHCSQLHPELKRLSEAPLAESALRDLLSSEEREVSSSVSQEAASLAWNQRRWSIRTGHTHRHPLHLSFRSYHHRSSRIYLTSSVITFTQLSN